MLMDSDETFWLWSSARGVYPVNTESLEASTGLMGTKSGLSSCFALSSDGVHVITNQSAGEVAYKTFDSTSGKVVVSSSVPADTWTDGHQERAAATCFAPSSHESKMWSLTLYQGSVQAIYAGKPAHNLKLPSGCGLNGTVGSPLLVNNVIVAYASCGGQLPDTLVAWSLADGVAEEPLWSLPTGFIDPVASDYVPARAAGTAVLWQNNYENEPAKQLGAVDSHSGKALWTRSIDTPSDGILSASPFGVLIFTAQNCTFSAVKPDDGTLLWSFDASDAGSCTILAQYAMINPEDAGGALLVWKNTGQTLLLQISPNGTVLQQVDFSQVFGPSILPPNGANVLVTSDGGAVIFLGSPDRLVRLKGSASKRD